MSNRSAAPPDLGVPAEQIGLAHDYLLVMRGAERVFSAMADLAPRAPIYTLLHDARSTGDRYAAHPVVTSPLQHLPLRQRGFRAMLPLFPGAMQRLSACSHQLVVSSSSAFAHGISTADDAVHVCYCHSPFRYAWFEREQALAEVAWPLRPLLARTLRGVRERDRRIARGVTQYLANSRLGQERIRRCWGRDARIVHPPVEVERFSIAAPEDFFLLVGEIVRHKRQEVALEAATLAGKPVVVVGEGPELERLRAKYGSAHRFVGRVDDTQLAGLYSRALALIVPNVEEFGIAAVEAQAAGRPVVGAAAGGLTETVLPGETGELVPAGDVDALAEVLAYNDFARYDSRRLRANAERFSTQAFQARFTAEVRRAQHLSPREPPSPGAPR